MYSSLASNTWKAGLFHLQIVRGQADKSNPPLGVSLLLVWSSTYSPTHCGLTLPWFRRNDGSVSLSCIHSLISSPHSRVPYTKFAASSTIFFSPCQLLPHHSFHPNSITKAIDQSLLQSFKKCYSEKYTKRILTCYWFNSNTIRARRLHLCA